MTQGARNARNSSVRMQYKALLQCMMTRAQHISRAKMYVKFRGGFLAKNAEFHGIFCCSLNPRTPLSCTYKAYLHYLMSLTVILLLMAMLTAGPDRLYRVARSHVQLGHIGRTDCILMDNY